MSSVLSGTQIVPWGDQFGNQIVGTPKLLGPTRIEISGRNNSIHFAEGVSIQGTISFRGNDSEIHLGNRAMFRGRMNAGSACKIVLGNDIYWGPNGYVTAAEATRIDIGSDILISEGVTIRADDSHPIYDLRSGGRINKSESVKIGDHVWLGVDVLVMPGSKIGRGAVVGARSLVTGSHQVEEDSLVVGSPAKAVRDNIRWERKHLQTSEDIPEFIGSSDRLGQSTQLETGDTRKGSPPADVSASVARQTELLEELVETNSNILKAINSQIELQKKNLWESQVSRRQLDVLRIESTGTVLADVQEFVGSRQLSFIDTVRSIANDGLSFARFGDGEMKLMLRSDYWLTFQRNSPELALSLRDVLNQPHENLMIGFPHLYRDIHWSGVWADVWPEMRKLVSGIDVFGNSHVSRPVFFQLTGDDGVAEWRRVWDGKRVAIVTGRGSRFELIPELFDCVRSSKFIYSSAKDAYDDLDRLLEVLEGDDTEVYLLSLGPAGTVLAHLLASKGLQAIDIGHISDSYLNVFNGGSWPESKPATKGS